MPTVGAVIHADRDVRFQPRMTLQTLGRGDGLLGMRPSGSFGPRGGNVTVVQIDWMYQADGAHYQVAAPATLRERRPASARFLDNGTGAHLLARDRDAEANALDRVWEVGLLPLSADTLQWRADPPALSTGALWSLRQESTFADFWAETLPVLQAEGWSIVVRPGFVHESVPVDAWHLLVDPASGEAHGKEVGARLRGRAPVLTALDQTRKEASWSLSLGVEVEGALLDLVPMLAHLLQRDTRWLDADKLSAIADEAQVLLRAPDGKRIHAPAGRLKPIVAGMLELLADPQRCGGPLPLSAWDAQRFDRMCADLMASQRERAGEHGAWQLRGQAGLQALAQRLQDAGTPPAVLAPPGLGITLRPYQLQGVAWLQYLRRHDLAGILADDMGLGKTAQALAHILLEKQAGRLDHPALIVLPTSLIFNWKAESRRIAPALRLLTLQGAGRAADFACMPEHDVVLTTYPLLWRDIAALAAQPFHLVILDEAQTVKNAGSRSAGAIRKLRARHRLCLTGTPLENHLGELWAQFDFLMPGFLGDARGFARVWRRPIEVNGETLRAGLLAQRVRPFILRRRKDEVATELPPRVEILRQLSLRGHQRDLYESVRVAADSQIRRVLARKGFTGGRILILDALLKLRQVCCDPYLLKGIEVPRTMPRAKIELLRELLPQLVAEGRRILLFSQFTELLGLVAVELDALQLPWLALTGATAPAARGAVVAQFQAGATPILVISLKAGGVGLNLTAADTVIHMDPWWNPAVEEQATARAHRIGQTHTVFVYKLVVEGSIEERILALQARKAQLAESVLGSDHDGAQKFTPQDLQALLAPLA